MNKNILKPPVRITVMPILNHCDSMKYNNSVDISIKAISFALFSNT